MSTDTHKASTFGASTRTLKTLSPIDIGWLAGFLEGEGCFTAPKTHRPHHPRVYASSTDEDVLKYVFKITGLGHLYGPCAPHPNNTWGKKPRWDWRCNGVEAAQLMRVLLPYMKKRRGQKIRQL